MIYRRSLNFGHIGQPTMELSALEGLNIPHRLIKRCCHFFSAVFDLIFFILAGNYDIHNSLDEFQIWPDLTTELAALEHQKHLCCHFFSVAIYPIHFKFVGIQDIHNI